ncbi:hypothetical protein PHYPSEUDO_000633 [Phytophthora pseudosyringae]|uniref:Major facilitator superfamily (MFS) profile domain-containing protein n=1 Tax=Phytophthora pseudosyringae TaxID=221518 RepID=A0A8T1VYW9_9STRA|nr:hypothetical protein PHYPSEUDO_000633 [Phytophthora pseudosyringae]
MPLTVSGFHTNTPLDATFNKDIRDLHLIYAYDAESADGKPEKWRYELWFLSLDRVVYVIHGGPWLAASTTRRARTSACVRASCGNATGWGRRAPRVRHQAAEADDHDTINAIVMFISRRRFSQFIVGRLVSGLTSGVPTGLVSSYSPEFRQRIQLVLHLGLQICFTFGLLVVVVFFFFADTSAGWRVLAGFPVTNSILFS